MNSYVKRFVSKFSKNNFLFGSWKKNNKKGLVINNVNVRPAKRDSQDISKWRNAIVSAEGYSQARTLLFDLYNDMLLDGYLNDAVRKRVRSITNRKLTFTINGKEVEDVVNLTKKSFFRTLSEEVIHSRMWGHSLIELDWAAAGGEQKSETNLIPRKHVKPRYGIVTPEQYGIDGIPFREDKWNSRLIEVGKEEDLGLLLQACQYVIYKRGNFGDWAEYAEVFGMPFRWATYDNESTRGILEEAMDKAGSAGFVVAPTDAKLEFMQANTQNGADIFDKLRKSCNEEISITINGNTMTTTEAKSSGYAQSKTHQLTQDEIHADDRLFLIEILNEQLIPILEKLGYKVKGGEWSFKDEENISLKDRIEIDLKVSSKVPIGISYWYEKYGIPVPTADDLPTEEPETEKAEEKNDNSGASSEKKKTKTKRQVIRRNELKSLHDQSCNHINLNDEFSIRFAKIDEKIVTDFLTRLYHKQIGTNQIHDDLYRSYYTRLIQFAENGFSQSMYKPQSLEQLKMFESFKRNLSNFAAHKSQMLASDLAGLRGLPLKDYLIEAKKLAKRFNEDYLKAELGVASVAADSAQRWKDYQDRKDLYPNIQYVTAGDELVRLSHAAMDDKVFAVDDPIWDSWMPPNGYNCRCTTISSDKAVSKPIPTSVFVDKGFDHNPGKSLITFNEDHPYFNISNAIANRINKQADQVRSEFESSDIIAYALQKLTSSKLNLPGTKSKVLVNKDSINKAISTQHNKQATKNALLTILDEILPVLKLIKQKGKTHYYQFDFLDDTYIFKFYQSGQGLELIGITDKI